MISSWLDPAHPEQTVLSVLGVEAPAAEEDIPRL